MDMFVIEGGRPLVGRVSVSGSKNASLPIMAAAIMAESPCQLHHVPDLLDVRTMSRLLRLLGLQVHWRHENSETKSRTLKLAVHDEAGCLADYDLVRQMRASVCVLGPLLAKRGQACVALPGGCAIGDRPIDLHLKGLRALGAEIQVERGYVKARAKQLIGSKVFLGGPFGTTVTGTCNVMSAATLARGVTTIESAACEPEVVELGRFLNRMGACIEGLGTSQLRIEGVRRLNGATQVITPDRIEAATLMMAAAMTRGEIELDNVPLAQMTTVIEKLREIGVTIEPLADNRTSDGIDVAEQSGSVRVIANRRPTPAEVVAMPYPGIPTDVQAQLMALLALADGASLVTDRVFPERFLHGPELVRLGANLRRDGSSVMVQGVERLCGTDVTAGDLRASAALVLAALAAEGTTTVHQIFHLDRGYERLEEKLSALGALVRRVEDTLESPRTNRRSSVDSPLSHREFEIAMLRDRVLPPR
ncbi:UDP-N-acetylglucosamine 1-carboxyvinyltransferase [Thalassoroseus pseudoceratinae]|uniref:UDP-N-acetylglucosamine 1-carboxyvinyltransferase n=1 Tax=Thalassoroseus pseudoceratinae TaxID=2713176 RepID=UPI00141D9F12|nr:UDP-N-acetylglucosamine 1-carboxyvinyltransferase [Thalassoroseus pseudoceratinae]